MLQRSGVRRRAIGEADPSRRCAWKASVAGLALVAGLAATPATADAAPGPVFAHSGNAFGTSVSVGSTVRSGPTAYVTLGCATEAGVHTSNVVAGVSVPPLASSGTIRTTGDTSASPTQTRFTAETEGVSLLNGLVTADLVKAVSTTTHDGTAFQVSGDGSTFVNLRIGGVLALDATPDPNTRVNLLGLGYVVLNEQTSSVGTLRASLTVNMLRVVITEPNLLNFDVGTEIIVSHARSALDGPKRFILDGRAFGTSLRVGSLVRSGPSAAIYMPCLGTNGKLRTNTTAGVIVPGVLTSGTVTSTAQGTVTSSSATGETTSTIQGVNLLNGLVTASVVKADAHASSDGTTSTFSDDGSHLVNLSVSGFPLITADAAPNTRVLLAGLGTLWIHRVIRTATSIEVRMIELVVNTPNIYGLAPGTNLRVGVASASVH